MIDFGDAPSQKGERFQVAEVQEDPLEAFRQALGGHGLQPGSIEPSGALVRFDVDTKGDKAGWYAFHIDGIAAGSFGNWKTGLKETWCSRDTRTLSDEESAKNRQFLERVKVQRAEQKRADHAKVKRLAQLIWDRAEDAVTHPYLARKKVPSHFLRVSRGKLIVPVLNEAGEIVNLQRIFPVKPADGKTDKLFLSKGQKQGCFFTIGGGESVYICEGYATGASIHAATGGTVIVAFDAGNLEAVARATRKNWLEARITICADNDRFTPGNPGITFGTRAAKAISARIVWPVFDGSDGSDGSDFNDLAVLSGLDAVTSQIGSGTSSKGKLLPLTASASLVKGRLLARPAPLDFIFKFNDQGFLPRGVLGVLTATGGVGKTFLLLSLAFAGATGSWFGPIHAPKPLKTLVIVGEDTQDELDRRLWDIGRGQFPDNLHAASVYGEAGPFMRLEGGHPVLADSWYWLDETLANHAGIDLLIFDPKSRFYGLDENSAEHATQWIQCLETLAKKHSVTILFSHHTSKDRSAVVGQNASRGSSAIVDGCRWQAGMARMDEKQAARLGVENARDYVILDVPKSNYAADIPAAIIFKRGERGVLEYVEPGLDQTKKLAAALLDLLRRDTEVYTKNELTNEPKGVGITRDMKEIFPGFKRSADMARAVDHLINTKAAAFEDVGSGRTARQIINVLGF